MNGPRKSTVRIDSFTGKTVIYAPLRRKRPTDYPVAKVRLGPLPAYDPSCPFCPGNEAMLEEILQEIPAVSGPWATRVVPNKFPIVSSLPARQKDELPGGSIHGTHEVIIETPRHDHELIRMTPEGFAAVLGTYVRRYSDVASTHPEVQLISVFRNYGPSAGTSLVHPHSQLIGTDTVPTEVRARQQRAYEQYLRIGRCPLCEYLLQEQERGDRIVLTNRSFIALVPYAAESPYEVWLLPTRHQADVRMTDGECRECADILLSVLRLLHSHLHDPDYNFAFVVGPTQQQDSPYLHWFLRIQPRLVTHGGFELGTGVSVNPSLPEQDALELRDVVRRADPASFLTSVTAR